MPYSNRALTMLSVTARAKRPNALFKTVEISLRKMEIMYIYIYIICHQPFHVESLNAVLMHEITAVK